MPEIFNINLDGMFRMPGQNRFAFFLDLQPVCTALRPTDWRVRFYQATNQQCEEIQIGYRNQAERAEADAVRRANESAAFPSHHREPGA